MTLLRRLRRFRFDRTLQYRLNSPVSLGKSQVPLAGRSEEEEVRRSSGPPRRLPTDGNRRRSDCVGLLDAYWGRRLAGRTAGIKRSLKLIFRSDHCVGGRSKCHLQRLKSGLVI